MTGVPTSPPVAGPRSPGELADLLGVAFTDQQLAAATAPPGPGLVVAGAGSGKTTVMAARVVWLVLTGAARPEQVLGLTFTNKAAGELATRVTAALLAALPNGAGDPLADGEPTVSTYHAYAGRLLAEHGLRLGVEPRARLLTEASRFQLVTRVVRAAAGPFPDLALTLPTVVSRVGALEAELCEHVVTAESVLAFGRRLTAEIEATLAALPADPPQLGYRGQLSAALGCLRSRAELLSLVTRFRAAKRELDLVDFGDQIASAVALAEGHPQVGAAERDRFRVVILDEYQDTSVAQRRMLSGLFGAGHPVTAVGDPCQAIYGWRGASVANLDAFPRHFATGPDRPAARLPLSVNQRSGGRLLELTNVTAAELFERHDVEMLTPRAGAAGAGDTVAALLADWTSETQWLATRLAGELAQRGLRPGQAAVLVRRGADLPALHAALLAAGLPVEVVGLGGLLHVPAVADIVATLTVLDDPAANVALLRLLAGPRWRIGRRDLAILGQRARQLVRGDLGAAASAASGDDLGEAVAGADAADLAALGDALADPGSGGYSAAARARFAALSAELAGLRRHVGEPLLDLVSRVLRVSGLDVEVSASPETLASGAAAAVATFTDHAAGFSDLDGESGLSAFLAYLATAAEEEHGLDASSPSTADAVALLTVHKAKGLEWEVVAVPDLTAGVFPSTRPAPKWVRAAYTLPVPLRGDWDPQATHPLPTPPDWSKSGLQRYDAATAEHQRIEELRLAYVALTRARTLLLASGHWWGPTQKNRRGPSPVLDAIAAHCQAGHGEVAHWEPEPHGERPAAPGGERAPSWPVPLQPQALARRQAAAEAVLAHLERAGAAAAPGASEALTEAESLEVAQWQQASELLLAEARQLRSRTRVVELPASLTASQVVRLGADPQEFARSLARPMPRPPSPAAELGTRFHSWVEAQFGVRPLLDADDLPGASDAELSPAGSAELAELAEAFRRQGWLDRPPSAVEAPFELVLGSHVIRGRIDAVYAEPDGGWHVVDWKTGTQPSDPMQLAVYRLAWAELAGIEPEQVKASFLTVRTGELLTPAELPAAAELVRLLERAGPG